MKNKPIPLPKPKAGESSLKAYLDMNPNKWNNRILIGTPALGMCRMEWVVARYGQVIPTNWSHIETMQWMSSHIPMMYQVPDAENLIAKHCIEGKFEWLLFIEQDNILPPNTFVKLNHYMIKGDVPVVAGLYFTKSDPPEPMIYRTPGHSFYANWKLGEKVWARGVPFGCTLIHSSIIKALWDESPEYKLGDQTVRRIFKTPEDIFFDPTGKDWMITQGTTDLNFCNQLIKDRIFEKAGWPQYQKKEFPFLVDTSIFVKHIGMDGIQYPTSLPVEFMQGKKPLSDFLEGDGIYDQKKGKKANKKVS